MAKPLYLDSGARKGPKGNALYMGILISISLLSQFEIAEGGVSGNGSGSTGGNNNGNSSGNQGPVPFIVASCIFGIFFSCYVLSWAIRIRRFCTTVEQHSFMQKRARVEAASSVSMPPHALPPSGIWSVEADGAQTKASLNFTPQGCVSGTGNTKDGAYTLNGAYDSGTEEWIWLEHTPSKIRRVKCSESLELTSFVCVKMQLSNAMGYTVLEGWHNSNFALGGTVKLTFEQAQAPQAFHTVQGRAGLPDNVHNTDHPYEFSDHPAYHVQADSSVPV